MLSGNEEIALRLGAALVLGSAIGLNRALHGKPAGLRTHALVTLGAAVAMLVALRSPDVSTAIDPNAASRIVQGILTGIGFLGAGVILHDSSGRVSGLTTAATIWICAVLGIICGLGYWFILTVGLVLTLIALFFDRPIDRLAERCFKPHHKAAPASRLK